MVHILSKNEAKIIEYLSNNPSVKVNINQLSKILGISVGSTHLILKDFEKEGIVNSESIGNSMVYKIRLSGCLAKPDPALREAVERLSGLILSALDRFLNVSFSSSKAVTSLPN